MCVVLSARNHGDWKVRRFVELIGLQPDSEKMEILFGIYADNNNPDGQPSVFKMLHPGNVYCEEIQAWPLPRHPDERSDGEGILSQIYGQAFNSRDGSLYQDQTLTGWDSWREKESTSQQRVYTMEDYEVSNRVRPDFSGEPWERYIPFTAWTVGPFTIQGSHLLTFRMTLVGSNYRQVAIPYGRNDFRIDGPEQIYNQLKFAELTSLGVQERRTWESYLLPFDDNRLSSGEGYDVIFLKSDREVEVGQLLGAIQAPLQPEGGEADRFISAHQSFSLELHLK